MDDGGQSEDARDEASEEELKERRRSRQLPVDQQALNIIGLAQAREYLRSRGAPPPPEADEDAEDVDDVDDLDDVEADADLLDDDLLDDDLDEVELQRSVDRHPAARARHRRRN